MKKAPALFLYLLFSLLLITGCGGGSSGGGGGSSSGSQGAGTSGTVSITAPFPGTGKSLFSLLGKVLTGKRGLFRYIPPNVDIYTVKVCQQGTDTSIIEPVAFYRPSEGGDVTKDITGIPQGWKTIRVFAYDNNKNLLAEGSSDVNVTADTINEATITLNPTSEPPSVTTTNPVDGATGVSTSSSASVSFNMPMDSTSITSDTFSVKGPQGAVSGAVAYGGVAATFTPQEQLQPLTLYTATVTGAVKNSSGLAMGNDFSWSFTTGEKPDTNPPTVTSTSPAGGATNVETGTIVVSAVFSKSMNTSTINSQTFTLTSSGGTVDATITAEGNTATLLPKSQLSYSTVYTATVKKDVHDLSGNAMTQDYTWSFTTKPQSGGGGGGGGGGSVATRIAFYTMPSYITVDRDIAPAVQVELLDQYNNRVTSATNSITISLYNDPNPPTQLTGTLTVAAVGGVATFDDLNLDRTGTGFTLEASSAGFTCVVGSAFDVGDEVIISDTSEDAFYPQIALNPVSRKATAAWFSGDSSSFTNKMVDSSSYDIGVVPPWSTSQHISGLLETNLDGIQISMNSSAGNSSAVAVWGQKTGSNYDVYANDRSAGAWDASSTRISTITGNTYTAPQVTFDNSDNAVAVWQQRAASGAVVVLANRLSGTWGAESEISSSGSALWPKIAGTGGGNSLAVWSIGADLKSSYRPSAGPWGAQQNVYTPSAGSAVLPSAMAGNSSSRAITAYVQQNVGLTYDVYASYGVSPFDTASWTAAVMLTTTPQADTTMNPQAVIDTAGNSIILWSEKSGGTYTLKAKRRTVAGVWDGAPTDLATGLTQAPLAFNRQNNIAMSPATGDAVVVWSDNSNVIRAKKYDAGTNTWDGDPPTQISHGSGDAYLPQAAIDDIGNIIVVWEQELTSSIMAIIAAVILAL